MLIGILKKKKGGGWVCRFYIKVIMSFKLFMYVYVVSDISIFYFIYIDIVILKIILCRNK